MLSRKTLQLPLLLVIELSVILGLTMTLSGCDSFLSQQSKSQLTPENTYTSTRGFELAVVGLYDHTRTEWAWGPPTYPPLFIGTDVAYTGNDWVYYVPFAEYGKLNPAVGVVDRYWDWAYEGIGMANQLLFHSKKGDIAWAEEGDKARIQAAARFFRAYYYHRLAGLYGDVPLVKEYAEDIQLGWTRTDKEKVFQFAVKDLVFASKHLPLKAEDGRLTKGAAHHLLADIYLHLDQPAKAEAAAEKVLKSGVYQLMTERFGNHLDEPGDVYSDLFAVHNQNRSAGNLEGIWTVQLEYEAEGGGSSTEDWSRRAWGPYYSSVDCMVLADSLGGRSLGNLRPTQYWLNLYGENDVRASKHNIRRGYWYNDPSCGNSYGEKVQITKEMRESGAVYAHTTKFYFGVIEEGGSPSYLSNMKDRYVFRLAGTYLLAAEAEFKQGKGAEAAAHINKVRERAHTTPITAADVTLDFILDERARELLGEVPRRMVLVRTGTLLERVRKYNPESGPLIQEKHARWPIPQDAIDRAGLKQNPGY